MIKKGVLASNWQLEKYLTQSKSIDKLIFEDSIVIICDTNDLDMEINTKREESNFNEKT
jgi:hypothetical protein